VQHRSRTSPSLADHILRAASPAAKARAALVDHLPPTTGQRILDLSCGSGGLAILVKDTYPLNDVVAVNADPGLLRSATRRTANAGAAIGFTASSPWDLPFTDGSFDHVLSSLALHQANRTDARRALTECHRVLRPSGMLHLADWGRPHDWIMSVASWTAHSIGAIHNDAGTPGTRLPQLMWEAGFVDVLKTASFSTLLGTITVLRARRPFHHTSCGRSPAAHGSHRSKWEIATDL
jgi:SAM-dependent methyltransferase